MSVEVRAKVPIFRILSDKPAILEHQVNELVDDYQALTWTIAVARDEVIVTVILIHKSEITKIQIANARMAGRMQ